MPIAFIRDMDSSSLARANGIFIMSDLRRSRHHEYDSTKRLLRNYCSVVTAPCRTTRTVFVTAPSHTNFATASKGRGGDRDGSVRHGPRGGDLPTTIAIYLRTDATSIQRFDCRHCPAAAGSHNACRDGLQSAHCQNKQTKHVEPALRSILRIA